MEMKRSTEGGMDMMQKEASNVWDAVKNERAGNDGVFAGSILNSEQGKELIDIMESLDKSGGWETEGETEMSLRDDAAAEKHSIKHGKVRTEDDQASTETAILSAQNELNALLGQLEPKRPIPKEQTSQRDVAPSTPSHVSDLLSHTKHHLAGMKAFAVFAKDKFQDPELGMRYQKVFLRRIDEAMSLLNSYDGYLFLSNPTRKTNTINRLFEEILTKHKEQFEDQQIEIIKKQFAEDLPETTVPEAQLEYILDSLMQYITHSTSPHGNLGLLTRLVDGPKRIEDENDLQREDRNYVEILFVFTTRDKKSDHPSSNHGGQGMGLILLLVEEIIGKNKGFMEVKPSDKNPMTFISLRLPVERRNVFEFRSRRSDERMVSSKV
jgi:hypothetical protein